MKEENKQSGDIQPTEKKMIELIQNHEPDVTGRAIPVIRKIRLSLPDGLYEDVPTRDDIWEHLPYVDWEGFPIEGQRRIAEESARLQKEYFEKLKTYQNTEIFIMYSEYSVTEKVILPFIKNPVTKTTYFSNSTGEVWAIRDGYENYYLLEELEGENKGEFFIGLKKWENQRPSNESPYYGDMLYLSKPFTQ